LENIITLIREAHLELWLMNGSGLGALLLAIISVVALCKSPAEKIGIVSIIKAIMSRNN